MGFQLVMRLIAVTFDGCFLDRAIRPFYLAIGPSMADLGEAMINVMSLADPVKGDIPISFRSLTSCKLDAVVSQDRVQGIRRGRNQIAEKVVPDHPRGLGMKVRIGKL